jgi:eukaryotic-like serine/threonine-protein kinase
MRITLTVIRGSLAGDEYIFEDRRQCIIGRAEDCDIRLPWTYEYSDVSRHHCLLTIDPPSIQIRDLGSANGTYVNGNKIGQRPRNQLREEADLTECPTYRLRDGDVIRVGQMIFRVDIGPGAVPSKAEASSAYSK